MGNYDTIEYMLRRKPAYVADGEEQLRLAAYDFYDDVYWANTEAFKLTLRGTESDRPLYLPSGRQIVDIMHRFTAPKMRLVPDPLVGTPEQQAEAQAVLASFLRRERFFSNFSANKRNGIKRGDWCWHLYADGDLPAGARISIQPIHPGSVFPVYYEDDVTQVIGYHIIRQTTDKDGNAAIGRLTYMKQTGMPGPSLITVEDALFEVDDWGGPGMDEDPEPIEVIRPTETLPAAIDSLPVYVLPHKHDGEGFWGSSEMRGLERIMAAMNQVINDEDLALSLESLGVYATNAGTPVDADGNDVPWQVGPGRVLELPSVGSDGQKVFFERVDGIDSVQPFQDHLGSLRDELFATAGIDSVARGQVEVDVAESGVALALRLAPLFASAEDNELIITDVHTNLFWDLRKWFVAYEDRALAGPLEATAFVPQYGDRLPPNRKQEYEEVMGLLNAKAVPLEWALEQFARITGMPFGDTAALAAAAKDEQLASAMMDVDPTAERMSQETGGIGEEIEGG